MKQSSSKFPIIKIDCEMQEQAKIDRLVLKLKNLSEVQEIGYKIA